MSFSSSQPIRPGQRCLGLRRSADSRSGLSVVEVFVVIAVLSLLVAVAVPFVLQSRDSARRQSCRTHLRQLALGLTAYHDTYSNLPPAAVWSTDATVSLALHSSKRIDLISHENWAVLLLPFVGHEGLSREFARGCPIGSPDNVRARTTQLDVMTCPADTFNRKDNRYQFCARTTEESCVEFARGNYAINGGTHDPRFEPPTTAFPNGDTQRVVMNKERRQYEQWGNGIAGVNRSFGLDECSNGQSTLVALEELRSGIHPFDPRGVWSLGQIGGSITWGHGVNGDAYSPNNQWPRSDDILGCRTLHEIVGAEMLMSERMPCVNYVDANQQVASRSQHPGGVHVAFLDGSVRFIVDEVDPGLWHAMHSRETPAGLIAEDFEQRLCQSGFADDAPPPRSPGKVLSESATDVSVRATSADGLIINSIGMTFVLVPSGEFHMGVADQGNGRNPPPECPAHRVRITQPFLLGTHEVTQGQFREVMGSLQAAEDDGRSSKEKGAVAAGALDDELPIANVTWHKTAEFCRRLSERAEELEGGRWYRLPSEAEWEYACRSGKSEPYNWSRQRRSNDRSGEAAGIQPPLPVVAVRTYPPNAFGLYDMRGNVWEWTADWFDRDYYARSPVEDPRGPANGYVKVVRGGDWTFIGETCRINYPMMPPWKANPRVGFRIVCELRGQRPARVAASP